MAGGRRTILCMYSGGIDSTGVLHRLLTEEEYRDFNLIVHHIHIFNRENRAKAEANAVKTILSYYAKEVKRDFLYTESVFNTTGFAPLRSDRFPFDMDVCAFMAGNLCVARKDIAHVAMGRTKTDLEGGGENFQQRMQRAQGIFREVTSLDMPDAPSYIFPVVDFTKKQIWDFLPEKVRSNTWWCRRPKYMSDKSAVPCQQCKTCQEVAIFQQ